MSKVSIIIPTYQRAHFVVNAIRNAQAQTYQDIEIIVVNDGSTDETATVLAEFSEQIVLIHHQENRGLSAALNTGIRASTGQYIAYLDDDDLWLPEKLEKQVRYLEEHPNIGLLYSDGFYFSEKAGLFPTTCFRNFHPFVAQVPSTLLLVNYVPGHTVIVRRACFDEVGLYDESLRAAEDYDMWLRIFEKYDVAFLQEPLACYNQHGENQMQQDAERMIVSVLRVKEKAFLRNPTLRRLPKKIQHSWYYDGYLTLARYYIEHGKGQAARLSLRRYYRICGVTRQVTYLWALSWLSPGFRLVQEFKQRQKRRVKEENARALACLEEEALAYMQELEKRLNGKSNTSKNSHILSRGESSRQVPS